jgi:RNA polymerase sigma factor (sigma-70 family)
VVTPLSTHASLLARVAAGADASAWTEFAERYRGLIRGYGLRRGLQPADADDFAQDVFVALTTALRGFEYDSAKGSFRGFLRTIAVRALGRRFRDTRPTADPMVAEETLEDAATPDEEWETEWRQYHLREAMRHIQAECRASDLLAFEMLTRDGRDAKGVAAELGISIDSAYQAKSRILKRLRVLVAEQVAAEG